MSNEKVDGVNSSSYPMSSLNDPERREPSPAYSQYYSSTNLQQPQQAYGLNQPSQTSSLRNQYSANNSGLTVDTGNNPYGEYNVDLEKNADTQTQQQDSEHHRTRSVRSFFSSRSRGSGRRSHEQINNNENQDGHSQNNSPHEDGDKLLPTVEEDEYEEEEDLPDIKDVVNEMEEDNSGKRRGHAQISRKSKKKVPSKAIKAIRDVYTGLLSKSLLTRSIVYWFPLALILFIPLAVGAWAVPGAEVGHVKVAWLFIWLEIVWAALWVGRFVAHAAPFIFQFLVGIVSPSWKKYSSILNAVEMPLSYVFWALISMCTFMPVTKQNPESGTREAQDWQKVVQNILVALLISSLVYLAERLLIHFLSVSFHKTRFAKRIKDNRLAIRVLSQLLEAAYTVFPQFCKEFENDDLHLEAGVLLNKGKQIPVGFARKLVTSNNVQQVVGNLNRVVGGAAKVLGNVGRDIAGNSAGISTHSTVVDALANRHLAETLAQRIWMSLVLEGADELTIEDLIDVLGEHNRDDAEAVFSVLDADGNGNLTMDEMVSSVQGISKERKTIFRSLRDVDSAIGKLHSVLLFVVVLIIIIIFIGMLAPSVSAVLATLGTSLLALSFVFSPTAQEVLGSCVFLFVKHPFDVGDMVSIATPNGVTRLIVVEISLLFTVFNELSTGLQTQAQNATLNTLWIDNVTRSGYMSTSFNLILGLPETSLEDIDKLKERLDQFIDENERDYMPGPYFQVIDLPDLDRLQLCINMTFKGNQHDSTLFGIRRTRVYQFLGQCVHDIPLHVPRRLDTYNNPGLPIVISKDAPMTQPGMNSDGEEEVSDAERQMRPRPAMGFRPPKPPMFEFEGPSSDALNEKAQDKDETMLSPVERTRASGAQLGRLDSLASRSSGLSRKQTVTGRRKRANTGAEELPHKD